MSGYILSCCSTADLTEEHLNRRNIKYVCFHFSLDGVEYADDLGKSISLADFYDALKNGADGKTSQVNVDEFINYFTPFLEEGKDIIHVCLSSGLSGVYNSARVARSNLLSKYPERKIYIVDSLGGSSGYGLLVDEMADMRDLGASIERLYDWANDHKLELQHWFFSTDLSFFVKGGRVSKTAGFVGTVMKICPLLNVDEKGSLVPRYKIKGKKRVVEEIVAKMEKHARNGHDYDGKCYISHSACYDDARAVANLIEARFPKLDGRVEIFDIGTTVGCHTGPGTVALFFWGDRRKD